MSLRREHVPPIEAMILLVITDPFKLQRTMKKNNNCNRRLIFFFFFSKKVLLLQKSTGVLLLSHCSPLSLISYTKVTLEFNFSLFILILKFKLKGQISRNTKVQIVKPISAPQKICSISNMTLITNWGGRTIQTNTRIFSCQSKLPFNMNLY